MINEILPEKKLKIENKLSVKIPQREIIFAYSMNAVTSYVFKEHHTLLYT